MKGSARACGTYFVLRTSWGQEFTDYQRGHEDHLIPPPIGSVCWLVPAITVLERLRQKDCHEFEAGQSYMAGPYWGGFGGQSSSFLLMKKEKKGLAQGQAYTAAFFKK